MPRCPHCAVAVAEEGWLPSFEFEGPWHRPEQLLAGPAPIGDIIAESKLFPFTTPAGSESQMRGACPEQSSRFRRWREDNKFLFW